MFNFVCFQSKTPEYPSTEKIRELQCLGKVSDRPSKEELIKVWQEKYKKIFNKDTSSDSDVPDSDSSEGKEMVSESSDSSAESMNVNVGSHEEILVVQADEAGAIKEIRNISKVEPLCNGPIDLEESSGDEGDVLACSPEYVIEEGEGEGASLYQKN